MTDINIEYLPRLDLTLANNMHAAVDQLSSEKNFVVYDLNLSSSDKDILSEVNFKCNHLPNFQYNSTTPHESFSYNLQSFLDYKLVNTSYSEPLTDILKNIYTASIYDIKDNEVVIFEMRISCYMEAERYSGWHTDGSSPDYLHRNFITLVGPATSFYNDTDIRDQIDDNALFIHNNNTDNNFIDYSKITKTALGQGVIDSGEALHAAPCQPGHTVDRLFVIIEKYDMSLNTNGYIHESMEDPNIGNPKHWEHFWEIEA